MRPELLKWQWNGYPEFHVTRVNLLIHIVAVPGFVVGVLSGLMLLVSGSVLGAAISWGWSVGAFAAQAIGHGREPSPPIPFQGPVDAVTRILAEQFVTFPRFVLSGEWAASLRRAR